VPESFQQCSDPCFSQPAPEHSKKEQYPSLHTASPLRRVNVWHDTVL